MVKKILREIALLVSVIVLITSTINTTLSFIVTKTDTIVNNFKPFESIVNGFIISKTVEHPLGEDYVIPDNISFDFNVELGKMYADTTIKTTAGNIKADEKGNITLSVKPSQSIGVENIDAGTKITVTEVQKEGDGFMPKNNQATKEITILEEKGVLVEYVNVYTPENVKPLNVTVRGTKILSGRQWQEGDSFSFLLERKIDGKWETLGKQTVTYNRENTDFNKFDFSDILHTLVFSKAGQYEFRMTEIIGDAQSIDYDKTVNTFKILVSDTDMDGKLEIGNVESGQNASTTKTDDGFCIDVTFNNTFKPSVVIDDIKTYVTVNKTVENTGELSIGPENFEFILENTNTGIKSSFKSDENGKAVLGLTYGSEDIGKTYSYKLYEKNDGKQGVVYDTRVYDITVALKLSEDNTIIPVITVNSKTVNNITAQFTNIYNMENTHPVTRDSSNVYLWIFMALLSGTACVILVIGKRKEQLSKR